MVQLGEVECRIKAGSVGKGMNTINVRKVGGLKSDQNLKFREIREK